MVNLVKGVPDHHLEKPERDQGKKDFRSRDLEKVIRIDFRNSRRKDLKNRLEVDLIVTKINPEKEAFQSLVLEKVVIQIVFQNSRKMNLKKKEVSFRRGELKSRWAIKERELLFEKEKTMPREKKNLQAQILRRPVIAFQN